MNQTIRKRRGEEEAEGAPTPGEKVRRERKVAEAKREERGSVKKGRKAGTKPEGGRERRIPLGVPTYEISGNIRHGECGDVDPEDTLRRARAGPTSSPVLPSSCRPDEPSTRCASNASTRAGAGKHTTNLISSPRADPERTVASAAERFEASFPPREREILAVAGRWPTGANRKKYHETIGNIPTSGNERELSLWSFFIAPTVASSILRTAVNLRLLANRCNRGGDIRGK